MGVLTIQNGEATVYGWRYDIELIYLCDYPGSPRCSHSGGGQIATKHRLEVGKYYYFGNIGGYEHCALILYEYGCTASYQYEIDSNSAFDSCSDISCPPVTTTTTSPPGLGLGALYNWWVYEDARNIANTGWHVPDVFEWQALDTHISSNGGKLNETGFTYWNSPNTGATNEFGFNSRGAGLRAGATGVFASKFVANWIWSSWAGGAVYVCTLFAGNSNFNYAGATDAKNGASIRLVKDSTVLSHGQTGSYIGNDGKVYGTICINGVEYLSRNLNETKYRNGDWITGYNGGVYTPIGNAAWAALTSEAMCYYNDDESNG